nr:RluA family pseudouridine synthase [Xylophilus rhododendri]
MDSETDADPADSSEQRDFSVPAALHGDRLDRALTAAAPEFSRSYLQQRIAAGDVRLNGAVASKASGKVRATDRIEIDLRPTLQTQAFLPEDIPLDVVYEDEDLLVVNKPAGLVVHPAPGNWRGTLLNALLARHPAAATLPRAGIVHRLDKDTSGLMVVARSRRAMDALVKAIAARDVSRQYLALAHRPWKGAEERDIESPIGRDARNRLRMAVVDLARQPGKTARTHFQLLANAAEGCWVQCALYTGRTHQIRVHLASIGHSLVSDALYGGGPAGGMQRQALHAFRLAFEHPVDGRPLAFEAAPPADLMAALAAWGLAYNPPLPA